MKLTFIPSEHLYVERPQPEIEIVSYLQPSYIVVEHPVRLMPQLHVVKHGPSFSVRPNCSAGRY